MNIKRSESEQINSGHTPKEALSNNLLTCATICNSCHDRGMSRNNSPANRNFYHSFVVYPNIYLLLNTNCEKYHFKSGANTIIDYFKFENKETYQLLLRSAYMTLGVSYPQSSQGKSNMAGYGNQILVRNTFLWFISAIYLFAFSSLYVQIPGKCLRFACIHRYRGQKLALISIGHEWDKLHSFLPRLRSLWSKWSSSSKTSPH